MSTTSMAVVYAVMVETGLNKTDLGKLIRLPASSPTWAPSWPWGDLRQLRLLAADFHPGHRGGPVAGAGRHPLDVSQVGGPGE
jgi:hypothetical protein